jgi:hypothetical protein
MHPVKKEVTMPLPCVEHVNWASEVQGQDQYHGSRR